MGSLNAIVAACLQGSAEAFLTLDKEMRLRLVGSLQNRGATFSLAQEIAADVLADCCLPGEGSLLKRFDGKREFDGWLLRVAINRLIDRQRRQRLFQQEDPEKEFPDRGLLTEHLDTALRGIVKQALTESFATCEPQVRVLLWLSYAFEVKQTRLAKAWGWSESKLSRTLSSSCETIREKTLRKVRQIEPGLTLLWEDVFEVSAEMEEALFRS